MGLPLAGFTGTNMPDGTLPPSSPLHRHGVPPQIAEKTPPLPSGGAAGRCGAERSITPAGYALLILRELVPTLVISSAAEVFPATPTTAGAGEICALRASFIDSQRPALERLSIQAGDGPLNILAFAEFDKAESPRCPCHLVPNHHG